MAAMLVLCSGCVAVARQGVKALRGDGKPAAACDGTILPAGLGGAVDGPYGMVTQVVPDPAFPGQDILVLKPEGAPGPSPVILLAHGYGPNRWTFYEDMIRHLVSRGAVVVYAPYPLLGAMGPLGRYDILWAGFQAAVAAAGPAMDLTRVGIIGHSFGGGAVPFLAHHAFVEQGWGRRGAFTLMLAPWYAYGTDDAQMAQLPANVLQGWQVYDGDTVNDHRMAVDLYRHAPTGAGRYFFQVNSGDLRWPGGPAGGCPLTADHLTPNRDNAPLLKRLAVLPVADALADQAFVPSAETANHLAALGQAKDGYRPLVRATDPAPLKPQDTYRWPWNSQQNPRTGEGTP
ncbi:MAG: hypothetical protein PW843_26635 [Azospirillaceae bacterium]|nr:hypothetical protein [Azospirillaceae bacterium]